MLIARRSKSVGVMKIQATALSDKPFALLVPMETVERKYFADMFKGDKRIQIIIPKKRYEFESTYSDSSGKIPFKSVWICWKMNLKSKNNIIFE